MISNFNLKERAMSVYKAEDRTIMMQDKNITMVKGDTLCFGLELTDETGAPFDITNALFVARKDYNNPTALFEKVLGDGIEQVDDGLYSVKVSPEDTADDAVGRYVYQLKVMYGSDVYTVMRGILELESEVEE